MYYDAIIFSCVVNSITMIICMIGFLQITDILEDIRDSLENEKKGDEK